MRLEWLRYFSSLCTVAVDQQSTAMPTNNEAQCRTCLPDQCQICYRKKSKTNVANRKIQQPRNTLGLPWRLTLANNPPPSLPMFGLARPLGV